MIHQILKKTLLSITVLLVIETNAQVTIGSHETPVSGALLQLSNIPGTANGDANATMGLGMPRVELSELNDLFPMFESTTTPGEGNEDYDDQTKKGDMDKLHTGLIVYNTSKINDFCPGVHVWDGDEWIDLQGYRRPDILMTDADGNVYDARWFNPSPDPCDLSRGAYWTRSSIYSAQKATGGQFNTSGYGKIPDEDYPRLNPAYSYAFVPTENSVTIFSKADLTNGVIADYGINLTNVKDYNIKNQSRLDYAKEFGLLYNYSQAREVCPTGWRLPTTADWHVLIDEVHGASASRDTATPRLRKASTWKHYYYSNDNPNNTPFQWGEDEEEPQEPSGFDAVPAGHMDSDDDGGGGRFFFHSTYFWTQEGEAIWFRTIKGEIRYHNTRPKHSYISVRCIKE